MTTILCAAGHGRLVSTKWIRRALQGTGEVLLITTALQCFGSCGLVFVRENVGERFHANGRFLGGSSAGLNGSICGHSPLLPTGHICSPLDDSGILVVYVSEFSCLGTCGRVFVRSDPDDAFSVPGCKPEDPVLSVDSVPVMVLTAAATML